MSWEVVAAFAQQWTKNVRGGVVVAGLPASRTQRHALSIIFRPRDMGVALPDWLAAWKMVDVRRGVGAFAGMLRVAPNGPHRVLRNPNSDIVTVRIPALPGQPAAAVAQTPCGYELAPTHLDIVLPPWCCGAEASPPPAAPPPAPVPPPAAKKAPFTLARGVLSHPEFASDAARTRHREVTGS